MLRLLQDIRDKSSFEKSQTKPQTETTLLLALFEIVLEAFSVVETFGEPQYWSRQTLWTMPCEFLFVFVPLHKKIDLFHF